MPTRILSWQQLVLENDPDWIRGSLNPIVWEFSNGRRFMDPTQVYFPLPDSGLYNNGGVLALSDAGGWPTSSFGLWPGAMWNNNGEVAIVPGLVQQPGASPLFFGEITASQLLLFGSASMPTVQPFIGSLQLWNNGHVVCVA